MITDIWKKKPLRSMYDPTAGGHWFSVIDLFAMIRDSSHQTARGYWKRLKRKQTRIRQTCPYLQKTRIKSADD